MQYSFRTASSGCGCGGPRAISPFIPRNGFMPATVQPMALSPSTPSVGTWPTALSSPDTPPMGAARPTGVSSMNVHTMGAAWSTALSSPDTPPMGARPTGISSASVPQIGVSPAGMLPTGVAPSFPGSGFFPFPVLRPAGHVYVMINGDRSFPELRSSFAVPYAPGLTISQALAATQAVRFYHNGQIAGLFQLPIGSDVSYRLTINGRIIPSTLLNFPIQPNDRIELTLLF